ncbi:type II toxin-antitoxin system YafQ family toxin [Helicobacter pylori]|nr:type II toxin-antitoxin system YafQ family toxin [Helicobacter pylori]
MNTTICLEKTTKSISKMALIVSCLMKVVLELRQQKPLAPKHKDHTLKGEWYPCRECHIKPNILLVYTVKNNTLWLLRFG